MWLCFQSETTSSSSLSGPSSSTRMPLIKNSPQLKAEAIKSEIDSYSPLGGAINHSPLATPSMPQTTPPTLEGMASHMTNHVTNSLMNHHYYQSFQQPPFQFPLSLNYNYYNQQGKGKWLINNDSLVLIQSKIGWETHRIYNFNGSNTIPIRK